MKNVLIVFLYYLIAINNETNSQNIKEDPLAHAKAEYKSGEIPEENEPITLQSIKNKLIASGIFNWKDPSLTASEIKEMNRLFDAVEIMTTSRMRQPPNVQNMFATLRLVERALKKQLKEGQISLSLASKFNWDKISTRHRRENKPMYYLDSNKKLRLFYIESLV